MEGASPLVVRYMPLWLIFLPVIFRWAVGLLAAAAGDPGAASHPVDVAFGSWMFWVWALTTNWQGRRLASMGGAVPGNVLERKHEAYCILAWMLVSLIVTILVLVPSLRSLALVGGALMIAPPVYFLRNA